jgi:WD40 repeat protein
VSGLPPDQLATEVGSLAAQDCDCVSFSPDGTALMVAGSGQLVFCEYPDRPVWTMPWATGPPQPADVVWGAAAERLYALGEGIVAGFDAVSGGAVALPELMTESGALSATASFPPGHLVAVGAAAGPVLILDERSNGMLALRGTDAAVAIRWAPDGSELCIARQDSLEFWDVTDQAMLTSVHIPDGPVQRITWSPDGGLLAVVGATGVHAIRVGSLSDRAIIARWSDGRAPVTTAFSRDGSRLLIGIRDGEVAVTDRTLQLLGAIPADITSPSALSISGSGLLAARASAASVALWELSDTAPGYGRAGAADRRWAARHGRTVGRRMPSLTGPASGTARPVVLPVDAVAAPPFAWWPDGRTACVAIEPGTVGRIRPPGSTPLWQWPCPDGELSHLMVSHDGLVAAGHQGEVTVLESDGNQLTTISGCQAPAWSPQSSPDTILAVAEAGPAPEQILLYQPRASQQPLRRLVMTDGVAGLAWSPDGRLLAAAGRGQVVLWDTQTWHREPDPLRRGSTRLLTGPVAWSGDGRRLAALVTGDRQARVVIWNTSSWQVFRELDAEPRSALSWSPDGRLLAFVGPRTSETSGTGVDLWDLVTDQRLATLRQPGAGHPETVSWSPDGDRLAATYADGLLVMWDIAGTVLPDAGNLVELAFDRTILVRLACAAAAVGAAVPLSLLSGLLALLSGNPPPELLALAEHRGLLLLRGLGWPTDARIGLVTLLAADLTRVPAYVAPPDATRDALAMALRRVLAGASCPVSPIPVPVIELAGVLDRIDDRLLTFLELLGPEAVTAEPELPVRLRHLQRELTPLSIAQRRLLGVRVPLAGEGRSEGGAGGEGRAGVARHGRIDALLLSQLALPPAVFAIRHSRDELLYRTRSGSPPPSPRVAVLLLDDTAAAHGQVGVTLRLIAHLLATTMTRKGYRCGLVTLGEPAADVMLTRPEDLIRIWTAGTDAPPDLPGGARLAQSLVTQLAAAHDGDARIILLTHPYQPALAHPGAITVRVHYAGHPVSTEDPFCVILPPEPTAIELASAVSRLVG